MMQRLEGSTTHAADAVTALVLATFRLNGALVAAGDQLVADLGLTSARWRVLGAVALAGEAMTVAQIARTMGLARQSAQRIIGDLWDEGFIALHPNPAHRRAPLVRLTAKGKASFASAMARQRPWAEALADGIDAATIASASTLLGEIARRVGTMRPPSADDG